MRVHKKRLGYLCVAVLGFASPSSGATTSVSSSFLRKNDPDDNQQQQQGHRQQLELNLLDEVEELQLMEESRQPPPSDLANFGGDPDPSKIPLQVCEGDCDTDDDCDIGLVCFQREAFDNVPGCNNGDMDASLTDYCIVDPTLITTFPPAPTDISTTDMPTDIPTTTLPTAIPTTTMPTAVPTTTVPTTVPTTPVPTDVPTTAPTPAVVLDTTISSPGTSVVFTLPPDGILTTLQPTAAATETATIAIAKASNVLTVVGQNGDPAEAFPLQACQGDCDTDKDCDWGLYCHQRESRKDEVPGCVMAEGLEVQDFCAPLPEDKWVPGSFRLRMYWEEGYMWQESPLESFWCVTRTYENVDKDKDQKCWYGDKLEKCQEDQLYMATCSGADIRQGFVFLPTTISGEMEVLIQVAATPDDWFYANQCLEREEREIWLKTCDETNPLQRFIAMNGSFADGDKFELSQKKFTQQCVANDHHPKATEVLELHSCEGIRAPDSQTSYWTKY